MNDPRPFEARLTMCFSPEVSFASAAGLTAAGAATLWFAARRAPRMWPLAVVPLLFGVQQACEGLVWLGLRHADEELTRAAARGYLFFAYAFWPFWFSASAALIESVPARRRGLTVAAALATLWFWIVYLPVLTDPGGADASVRHHSIRYAHPDSLGVGPLGPWAVPVAYLVTAAVPVLASSFRRVLLVPLVVSIASAAVAVAVYDHAFTSVWCLFSAVLSAGMVYAVWAAARHGPPAAPAVC